MNMTNLHFHGLHVSPNAPQDDVLDMMASPGETLHYSVELPPQQPPGLYWYHTHSHGESDPIIRGMSLFHCHLLKHEDKGMMAKILFR
jgi:FtsP/CotA-like multicopper oxidase with cupredoxin domain